MRRFLKPGILIAIIIIIIALVGWNMTRSKASSTNNNGVTTVNKGDVKSQKITLNQTFPLAIPGAASDIKPLNVTFQSGLFTNRITISKKSRTARNGTRYLMLNMLIENNNTKKINFKTRDIVRLIDNNNKKFAPSLYNKTLALEPDSAKKDVVGFLVPEDIKQFKIQYGLPAGEKKVLDLNFE